LQAFTENNSFIFKIISVEATIPLIASQSYLSNVSPIAITCTIVPSGTVRVVLPSARRLLPRIAYPDAVVVVGAEDVLAKPLS
jgi:hypothetical protein